MVHRLGAIVVAVSLVGGFSSHAETPPETSLFPFVLPWDDASEGITNISAWLHKPAGKFGHITVGADGHLYAGKERIRLFGVDLSFSANFPEKQDAEKIADRMAKFGINIVRFHIMDMQRFPDGLLARAQSGAAVPQNTRDLDPEALDRLDYFTAQLARNGIYTYLCTLNYRPFNAADGLPKEIEEFKAPYQMRHVPGFFYKPLLELQKEYDRKLLTHRNPYLGSTYADAPAVAFVEINNENGLIHAWLGDQVDQLPEVFTAELKRQWNDWLRKRYGATDRLRAAWSVKAEPLGDEMLTNADFSQDLKDWSLERHAPAEASIILADDAPPALKPGAKSVCLTVNKVGTENWHIRFEQTHLKVQADRPYTLTFWAKSEQPCAMRVSIAYAHPPYTHLGFNMMVNISPQWQPFRFVPSLVQGDENARLIFDPPMQTGKYWLAGVSLRPGGVAGLSQEERLEDGTVPVFKHASIGERTPKAQLDWLRFLWETEDAYWQTLYRYLKDELKVKALVIGTIVGCSTPNLMARLDCVDTHGYWCHPVFPGRPWDPANWLVHNRSMVNDRGGMLPSLALRRVLGKPFSVTEHGHAAPNTYVSEGHLLRAAYSALQDWDYTSASRYSHSARWDLRRIRNFFDIDQHPTKMLTLLPAAAMFLRGDVAPAKRQVVVQLNKEREIEILRRSRAWRLVSAEDLGVPREAALMHRIAIAVEGQFVPADALRPEELKAEGDRFASDTGELLWDLSRKDRGVVTVNTPRSKAVIGFGAGKRFDLGGVIVEPGPTRQDGWSAITITAMEGNLKAAPCRLLITATGYAENTKMGWKNAEKTTVGKEWGEAPSLVEGIPARIGLPFPANIVEGWVLDERGQRTTPLLIQADPKGNTLVSIGPQYRTLWYEVSTR